MNPHHIHQAMQDAPHDNRPYRQARAAISAVQRYTGIDLWVAYTAATTRARTKAGADGANQVDAAYAALSDTEAKRFYRLYWTFVDICPATGETP
jgi:hypothetical protein